MWKLEFDELYFKIYDSNKLIAGYFDPDYGEIFPKENQEKIISEMLQNKDKIPGGFVMVPMIKFGLFDSDLNTDVVSLGEKLDSVVSRVKKWKDFLSTSQITSHFIGISHTDQDMLTITFPVKFIQPIALDEKLLAEELESILDLLQKLNLL